MTEYKATITTDKDGKYTITNEYTPEKIAVSGQRPGLIITTKIVSVQHLSLSLFLPMVKKLAR